MDLLRKIGTPRSIGGGRADSFALAVAHREGDAAVLDCLREFLPPFSPDSITSECARLLRRYRVTRVRGDRYAGEWPRAAFRKHGIEYWPADKPKSDLYVSLLPAINSGKVDFVDSERLAAQLCGLERRTARGGRDSIDHAPGGRDDLANCAAGAVDSLLSEAARQPLARGTRKIPIGRMLSRRQPGIIPETGASAWPGCARWNAVNSSRR